MTGHPYDDLEALALGDLDPASAEIVMRHADACPTCAAVLADCMRGVAALTRADGVPELEARAVGLRRPRRQCFAGFAAAAALVLAAWNIEMRATAPTIPVSALVHSHFTHHPLTGPGGSAKLVQALDGSWVYVVRTTRADLAGHATGYWARGAGKITQAALTGSGSTALRWSGR